MNPQRYRLTKAFFVSGNPWKESCTMSGALEEMVNHKMSAHALIELSLLLLVILLWVHNQKMHQETQEWRAMIEEYCER